MSAYQPNFVYMTNDKMHPIADVIMHSMYGAVTEWTATAPPSNGPRKKPIPHAMFVKPAINPR
jgi:hypothetical protein